LAQQKRGFRGGHALAREGSMNAAVETPPVTEHEDEDEAKRLYQEYSDTALASVRRFT
jgi:hypothetical protein